ncbi:MAG: hypothetical protein N2578_05735, partial [Bdellovibrionaceae bacterium]|nr:hypothetical protein [Pseudobdellovibrionaceae bacterium]
GGKVTFNAIGGTGRLGLGWMGEQENEWGYQGVLDLSGFLADSRNLTFASLEAIGIKRKFVGEDGEIRMQIGAFYKELPEVVPNQSTNSFSNTRVSYLGPRAGIEYWKPISRRFGLQLNAHVYLSLLKASTPNGEPIQPSMSQQFGFLGSYRVNHRFTGLAGISQRTDRISYRAATSQVAPDGGVNSTTVNGTYINFFAEYSF